MYGKFKYGQHIYGSKLDEDDKDVGDCDLNINNYLPRVVRDIEEFKEINRSMSHELCILYSLILDINKQFDLNTATWALDTLEKEVGLSNSGLLHQDRIEILQAKWRGQGTTTIQMIKDTAEAFSGGEVEIIEEYDKYNFIVKFVGTTGIPNNMKAFLEMLDSIKPAHLSYTIKYTYVVWGDLKKYTWEQLNSYTWGEVRASGELAGG